MRVEIRTIKGGKDNLAGVLSLEDGKIVAEPEIPLLQNILAEPVYSWTDKRGYDATEEPEEFLRALHQQYRSAYLRASVPQEQKGEEPKQHRRVDQPSQYEFDPTERRVPAGESGGGEWTTGGSTSPARSTPEPHASPEKTAPGQVPAPPAAPPAAPPTTKKKFGKSSAKVKINGSVTWEEVEDTLYEIFDNPVSAEEVASLVGAPDDAEVTLLVPKEGLLHIKVSHPAYDAIRIMGRDKNDQIYIKNDEFWVKNDQQGKGIGAEIFGRQVENAIEAGVSRIECHAAKENPRDPGNPHNGYYTWPRFGYDQSLEEFDEFDAAEFRAKKAIKKNFPAAKSILDVMATPAGREWWKKNGTDLMMAKFDLSEGSRSRRIFDDYLTERSLRQHARQARPWLYARADGTRDNAHVEEIDLDEEQAAALDRAEAKRDAGKETKPPEPAQYAKDNKDDADDHRYLAESYRDLWNLLHPDADEMAHADDELQEGMWIVNCRPDGRWEVLHIDDLPEPEDEGEQYSRRGQAIQYEVAHAPRGGVTINGKFFRGGQFIPAAVVAQATPEEKAKIEQGKKERQDRRAARGPVDVAKLKERLQGHGAGDLNEGEKRAALGRLRAIQRYHGELTHHRLEELTEQAEKTLAKVKDNPILAARARRELASLHHMAETGNVETKPKPTAAATAEPATPVAGKVYNVAVNELHVDPERFQFKTNTNKSGVTGQFKDLKVWNPDLAGVVGVWRDPDDGKDYIVNGHHRHELASRLGVKDMAVRYIDAKDAKQARAIGALINIGEERGTAVDASKFMRDMGVSAEDMAKYGVNLKGKIAADAMLLNRLSDRSFNSLARGSLDEKQALAVAKHLDNHALQDKLFGLLDKRKGLTLSVVEEMARKMAAAGTAKTTDKTLFGDIESEESLFEPLCDVSDYVRNELGREVNDYLAVANKRRAEKVAGAGNILNVEENKRIAEQAEQVKNIFEQLAERKGPIADALNAAAKEYHEAKTKKDKGNVKQQALESVRDAVLTEAGFGPEADAGGKGESVPGGGGATAAESGTEAAEAAPDAGRGNAGVAGLTEPQEGGAKAAIKPGNRGAKAETAPRDAGATQPPEPESVQSTPVNLDKQIHEMETALQQMPRASRAEAETRRQLDELKSERDRQSGEEKTPKPVAETLAEQLSEPKAEEAPKQEPSPKVSEALDRYANREATASGGGLFGGEDLQARRGFSKLPDGAGIVFTEGEFQGKTGKIVHDKDPATGQQRIVAEVEGRPGLVPISPDSIEPLDAHLSWRTEGGGLGAATKQTGLFAGTLPQQLRERDEKKAAEAETAAKPPEPGFTGIDAHGHKWVNGEQVAIGEKQPSPEGEPANEQPAAIEPVAQPAAGEAGGVSESNGGGNPSGSVSGNAGGERSRSAGPRIVTARAEHTKTANAALVPESVRGHLNEAQQQGTALAIDAMTKHGGFLLADGTGVGKTRQALAIAQHFLDQGKKVVIVSPAEVIKPDWKKGTMSGSFANDSATMGVPVKLTKGDGKIEPGSAHITTYNELGKIKDQIDKNTTVIFDESHFMKNRESSRFKHGSEIMDKAAAVMYATATPGDKPLHIAHLVRAGVFGNIGKTETYEKLGMRLVDQHVGGGRYQKVWRIDPKVGYKEAARRLSGLFDQMTKDGLMVKRELAMDTVHFQADRVRLSDEEHAAVQKAYQQKLEETTSAAFPNGNKAVALMTARMRQEPYKIPAIVNMVQEELAAGRSPIIFLGRVNDIGDEDESEGGEVSEGTAPKLREALIAAGIPADQIGELHGGATKTPDAKKKSMERFQEGKTRVMIATVQSGGTGINLDDTTGQRPRTVIMMTPPFTANDMAQAIGRVHRLNTKSESKVRGVLADTNIDDWNAGILENKFRTLGAVVQGESTRGQEAYKAPEGMDEEGEQAPFDWGHSLTEKPAPPVKISGNTYEHKDVLKRAGAHWNGQEWEIPARKAESVRSLSGLRFSDQPATKSQEAPKAAVPAPLEAPPAPAKSESSPMSKKRKEAVHQALRQLHAANQDRASERNGEGFNKMDSDFGGKLAESPTLTDRQAEAAAKMLGKYKRQLGDELHKKITTEEKPSSKPKETAEKPKITTKRVKTSRGERSVHSFSPSSRFWDARKAGKVPDNVTVRKDPQSGRWEASIWGENDKEVQDTADKLREARLYEREIEPTQYASDLTPDGLTAGIMERARQREQK